MAAPDTSADTPTPAPAAHHAHWPPGLPRHLTLPATHLFHNLEVSAARYPDKAFMLFCDSPLSYARFKRDAEHLAGHLQQVAGVRAGDRVLLCMQNSPQWAIGFYAILRANAVVVPVNPMNRSEELRHLAEDSGAVAALVSQELWPHWQPVVGGGGPPPIHSLRHLVVAAYADHLDTPTDLPVPDWVSAPAEPVHHPLACTWAQALAARREPGPLTVGPDDLCAMPYTSGTTGRPRAAATPTAAS